MLLQVARCSGLLRYDTRTHLPSLHTFASVQHSALQRGIDLPPLLHLPHCTSEPTRSLSLLPLLFCCSAASTCHPWTPPTSPPSPTTSSCSSACAAS